MRHRNHEIGQRLKHARTILNCTQKSIAEAVGGKLRSWQDYEAGQKMPGSQVIAGLSHLGINANWVLTGEGAVLILTNTQSTIAEIFDSYRKEKGLEDPVAQIHFVNDYNQARIKIPRPVKELYMVINPQNLAIWHDSWLQQFIATTPSRRDDDRYVYIPFYDIRSTAEQSAVEQGTVVEGQQRRDSLPFTKEWLNNELHANPTDLCLMYVAGESMEPTLSPEDLILVNHSDSGAHCDGIYVLRMDDALLIKRLQHLPGGDIEVTSDNPAYKPFQLKAEEMGETLALIGRVVWSGRRM